MRMKSYKTATTEPGQLRISANDVQDAYKRTESSIQIVRGSERTWLRSLSGLMKGEAWTKELD